MRGIETAGTTDRERRRTTASAPADAPATLLVALVGGGTMARHHARAIARAEGARVAAVAEPREEARRQLLALCQGAQGHVSLEDLLSEHPVDVVHVCTPPSSHVSLARHVLEAGAHVYVEKPFAPTTHEARELLDLAATRKLHVCAGHQLLYETPSRKACQLRPALGSLVHLESYFSFRQVRTGVDGRPALPAELQLLDILPHPVYLLLSFLEEAVPGAETRVERVTVGRAGTVHGLLRRGDVTGTLVVTLGGRPVESYLRLVGTNGSLRADYVRGTVQRAIGPGSSALDKAVQPYRVARQLLGGTTAALVRRILRRQKSYPGLLEILQAFYDAIRDAGPPPLSPESILETVRVCEEIGDALRSSEGSPDAITSVVEEHGANPRIVVTGGTGFLGREVVVALRSREASVRVLARRQPPAWERFPDVEYRVTDLGKELPPDRLEGIHAIIHCAAETAGGWEAHERNSVAATENLLRAAAAAGTPRVVHVSSIAVLAGPGPLKEDTPLATDKTSGPYVWGKAESERRARALGEKLDVKVRVVRPGAIVDFRAFEPPGRLGRRLGNLFVAVGGRDDILGAVEVRDVGQVLAWMALNFEQAPTTLNLVDPNLPSKRDLVEHLRRSNPDLRVVWLPRPLLHPLSWFALLAQKALRPNRPAINVAEVFKAREYDTARIADVWKSVLEEPDLAW